MNQKFEDYLRSTKEVGYTEKVLHSILDVAGLPGARLGEMVLLETGQKGQVSALTKEAVEVLVLSKQEAAVGTRVVRTGRKLAADVGENLLGRTIEVSGRVVSGGDMTGGEWELRDVDITPSGISNRNKITKPISTGVIMVDLMIPLGRGQRELVVGDRKTGKSHFLLQMMVAQAREGNVCVYAAVGKKRTEILKVENYLEKQKVMDKCVIVAASSEDSAGEIYLCPYVGMTISEYFRDRGRDVLLVLDDMTTHAKFYRELSLLSGRFPGRDSYPGDIFHVHSKLVERAGNFKIGNKEVSITCIPVVESVMGDITGYIQTNMMSMTDGHIYFDSDLFYRGRRPAVNPFISVTRVGRQTQQALGRDIARVLFELLNSYEKTQSFLKFGAELGENSRQILAMGDRGLAFFDQPPDSPVPPSLQKLLMASLISGMWAGKDTAKVLEKFAASPELVNAVEEIISRSKSLNELIEEARKQNEKLKILWN